MALLIITLKMFRRKPYTFEILFSRVLQKKKQEVTVQNYLVHVTYNSIQTYRQTYMSKA